LEPGYVDGFKVYPDRSQTDTVDLDQGVEGEMSQNVAFVPLRPGSYTLPSVKLYWWDTRNDKERVAELPERRVEVLPALSGQGMPGQTARAPEQIEQSTPAPVPGVEGTAPRQSQQSGGLAGDSETRLPADAGIWPWISLLFGLLWLATLLIWWRGRGRVRGIQSNNEQSSRRVADASQARSRFQAACRSNDARQARSSLLAWAAAHWPEDPPAGLDQLAQRLQGPQVAEALQALDRTLYRGDTHTWEGRDLAQRLSRLPKPERSSVDRNPLPDLYA
jgi:hypothetical protein